MRYTIKAAAVATGVAANTLRTWERRYGVPRPQRAPSGDRLYSDSDLDQIRRMVALMATGLRAREAAGAAREEVDLRPPEAVVSRPPDHQHELLEPLLGAAARFDDPGLRRSVRQSVDSSSWGEALESTLLPLLNRIGEQWGAGADCVAVEHFTCEVLRQEICRAISEPTPRGDGRSPVLMACAEFEQHELGLLAFSLLLRQQRLRVVYIGADLPTSELLALVEQLRPAAVCLSATIPEGAASLLRAAPRIITGRAATKLFVGGPAIREAAVADSIPGVPLSQSLTSACEQLTSALG